MTLDVGALIPVAESYGGAPAILTNGLGVRYEASGTVIGLAGVALWNFSDTHEDLSGLLVGVSVARFLQRDDRTAFFISATLGGRLLVGGDDPSFGPAIHKGIGASIGIGVEFLRDRSAAIALEARYDHSFFTLDSLAEDTGASALMFSVVAILDTGLFR